MHARHGVACNATGLIRCLQCSGGCTGYEMDSEDSNYRVLTHQEPSQCLKLKSQAAQSHTNTLARDIPRAAERCKVG
jgi:hypothetical protein